MSSLPLVAIVTPVYNGEPWLERTMANIQLQTYPNLVHVVLDNASADGTPETIAKFIGRRIPVVTARNSKVLPQEANFNAAFALAPPDAVYLKLNCADDLMRPDAIARMVAVAESDPEVDFVTANNLVNRDMRGPLLDTARPIISGREFGRAVCLREIGWVPYPHLFFRANPSFSAKPFDESAVGWCDHELMLSKLLSRKMGIVFEPLLYTHFDDDTLTVQAGLHSADVVFGYQSVMQHGDKFLTPDEKVIAISRWRGAMLRQLPVWALSGKVKSCALAFSLLHRLKDAPSAKDFVTAVLHWPLYKWDLRKVARARRRQMSTALNVNDFMTPMPLPEVPHPGVAEQKATKSEAESGAG